MRGCSVEIEITKQLQITDAESEKVKMHTIINIFNVMLGELVKIEDLLNQPDALDKVRDAIYEFSDRLTDPQQRSKYFRNIAQLEDLVINELKYLQKPDLSPPNIRIELTAAIANLQNILSVLHLRVNEILQREVLGTEWQRQNIDLLKLNLNNFFGAVERNAAGKYHIVTNIAKQTPHDYLVNLNISSVDGDTIKMPLVMQDILRDVVANSRKYTLPGGWINAGLNDDGKEITLMVEDSGLGIPEKELERVADFGYRGTNVRHLPTKGGGFGLTKAYLITKQFGGRMWIKSEENKGTRIKITIPRPSL